MIETEVVEMLRKRGQLAELLTSREARTIEPGLLAPLEGRTCPAQRYRGAHSDTGAGRTGDGVSALVTALARVLVHAGPSVYESCAPMLVDL